MRQGLAAAIALFAGCSFPHGERGNNGLQDASDASDGPIVIDGNDAMIMTDGMADAMTDAPPSPTDTDNDGVPDTADNCPMLANANQRDHDGDGKGDVCDRCPHLSSATDPDGDSDGVGDACDPRPGVGGDKFEWFEGFYDTSSIATWTSTGNGNWSVANGVLTQSVTTTSTTWRILTAPGTITRAAVTTGVRVGMFGNPTGPQDNPFVAVAAGVAQGQSYWCSVVDEGNNDKVYAGVFRPMMAPSFPNSAWPGTFAMNSELRMTVALLGNSNLCTVVQGATTATASGTIGAPAGGVQVATRTASAAFDYVFVVGMP
jgi:hypothetical protein